MLPPNFSFRLLTVFCLSALAVSATGPGLDVQPTAEPPTIDGLLDDDAWRNAAHTEALRQVFPLEDAMPTERTEFWVTYDADNLYLAVRCHDSAGPAGIRAYSMQHDKDNGSDDIVRIVIDTFHRQIDGYYFSLTAAGGRHDGLVQNKDQSNDEWDGLWFGRVAHDAGGWNAEFAIPCKSLSFEPANDTWGLNVARIVRRKQEVMRWSGYSRAKSTVSLPDLGEIRGLAGLRQGHGLEFRPFVTATHRSAGLPGAKRSELRPGADFIWHVTPSLAALLTVNTDFADAEVDERQVNLGRFPLFYPEKRSFFTQDAPLFNFAGIRQDPLPFFSRRIGLAGDGSRVDLLGGFKLTGRAGPWTIGLLDVQTDEYGVIDSKNLFVGRVSRQVFAESSVGLITTRGDPRSNGGNALVGADFNYVESHLFGSKSLTVRGALQSTDSDRTGGAGTAATLAINYPNEPFSTSWWWSRVDDRYDPALGFVSRTDVQNFHTNHKYTWHPERKHLRLIQPFVETDHVTDLPGRLLDDSVWAGFYAEHPHGDWLYCWVNHTREDYDAPFAIRPGIVIPVGQHGGESMQIQGGTARSRPVDVRLRWQHGDALTGRLDDASVELGLRPSHRLDLSFSARVRDYRLPEGAFQVRSGLAKAVFSFSPDLQLGLITQYDNVSSSLGVNFRLKWIMQPGNEFYVIVNQGYDTSLDRFRPIGNETSAKGAWTFRF